jgi:hypothetical protein
VVKYFRFGVPRAGRKLPQTATNLRLGANRRRKLALTPLLFPNLYPTGKDPSNIGLIMPFSKHRSEWLKTKATDTHSEKQYPVSLLDRKRLTKTPVRQAGSVLKCPDDRKNRVVSAQATHKSGSPAVGG